MNSVPISFLPPWAPAVLLSLLPACAGPEAPDYPTLPEAATAQAPATCSPVPPPVEGSPTEIKRVSPTRLLVNLGLDRRTALLSEDLAVEAEVAYAAEGPLGVMDASDVVLQGDSILVYGDRMALHLKRISLSGEERGTIRLGFPPDAVLPAGDGFLVSQTILRPDQDELLFRVDGAGAVSAAGASTLTLPDPRLEAMANMVILVPGPDGAVRAIHRFLEPRVLVLEPGPGGPARPVREALLPVPAGTRDRIGRIPELPLTEEGMMEVLTPALDAAPDPESGDLVILTRTGRRLDGHSEKVLLRYSPDLAFLGAVVLPMNAGEMGWIPGSRDLVLVDDLDRWWRCPAP